MPAGLTYPGGGALRRLRPGSCAEVRVIDVATGVDRPVFRSDRMLEAPNWTRDGRALYVNGAGRIALLTLDGDPRLDWITIDGITTANNDHLVSPDGEVLYVTSDGGVFAVSARGGAPRRLTPAVGHGRYYLHGISPDGARLSCTVIDGDDPATGRAIRLMDANGGASRPIAQFVGGQGTINVNSWSPDSRRLAYVAYPDLPGSGARPADQEDW